MVNLEDQQKLFEAIGKKLKKRTKCFVVGGSAMLYFGKKNKPALMERGLDRIDIFYKEIICFRLSETMIGRIGKIYEYGNLIVHIVSSEDIILLKSATERAGDRGDAAELIK